MPKVQFICLANSRKLQGRCVAGLICGAIQWIRPISTFSGGTLFPFQYCLDTGSAVGLLDIVEVDVSHASPAPHQPENWQLAQGTWTFVGSIPPDQAYAALQPALVHGPALLGNLADRVPHAPMATAPVTASLALVEPATVNWVVTTTLTGKRQIRCLFTLGGATYSLAVTDPGVEAALAGHPTGTFQREEAGIPAGARVLLTISLGEPFGGDCYKLVAAVLALP